MVKIDELDVGRFRRLGTKMIKKCVRLLPYFVAVLLAMTVVQIRWYTVDSDSYFIEGTTARQNYYAVRDMSYSDLELTEKLRLEAADSVVGVVVRGRIRTPVGFNDECEILINSPLKDTLLPEELREMLDRLQLDKREQIIATVRSLHGDIEKNTNMTREERDTFIWRHINLLESDPSLGNVIFQIITTLMDSDNRIDDHLTERMRDMVAEDISPIRHIYYAGDKIIGQNELITPQIAGILRLQGYPEGRFPYSTLTFSILIAIISVMWIRRTLFHAFIGTVYHSDWHYPYFLLILGWFSQVAVTYWGVNGVGLFPVIAVIYLTLPRRGALNCALAVTLSAAIITSGYDVTAFAVNSISGCAGAIAGMTLFRHNFSRSEVWRHIFGLGVITTGTAAVIQWGLTSMFDFTHLCVMFLCCLVLSLVVLVLLPLVEILFDIVSPLQLVELTQSLNPLMRRMQVEAPGTYHHSQMVGNLAEAVAEKMGLNPMLLRAGACYHDIGKLKRPQFFIENQITGINGHDAISPTMSAIVILSHVKDGLEMADECNLPSQIKSFIAEHHGTTCLGYFYRKALQEGLKVERSQFCYPGPKPQSKETAILMIADSSEAAMRAEGHNIRRVVDIQRLIDSVIKSKIDSGQLDEVPFTLKDFSLIKAALVETLRSMYHTRDIKPLKNLPKGQGKEKKESDGNSSKPLQNEKTEKEKS